MRRDRAPSARLPTTAHVGEAGFPFGAVARSPWIACSLLVCVFCLVPRLGSAQAGVVRGSPTVQRKNTTVFVPSRPDSLRMLADWIGMGSEAPASIPGERERGGSVMPITVVLASEIELGHQVYDTKGRGNVSRNVPRNVVLVADTIRITGPVTFDLSGDDLDRSSKRGARLLDRSGGDLILLARSFVCEANGKLIFRSSGGENGGAEQCSRASESTCRSQRATCDVVHGTDGSPRDVCRWDSTGNALANIAGCSSKGGIWTAVGSRYARNHPDAVPPGKAGACLTEVTNLVVRDHRSSPRPASTARGGLGGNLVIAAERFGLGTGLHASEAFRDLGCIDASAPGGAGEVAGRPGSVRLFDDLKDAVAVLQGEPRRPYGLPVASHSTGYAVSKWVVRLLDDAITGVRVAGLSAGKIEAARRLRQATDVVGGTYPLLAEDRADFEQHLISLEALQERYQTALWTSSRSLSGPGGLPLPVDLYTEGRELRTRVAPTSALVRSRVLGGRRVLGLLELDPDQPDTVRMEFEVELTVDPWLEALLTEALVAEGDDYAGMFSNWILEGRELSDLGIRDSEVRVSGTSVQVSLTVDVARASLMMAKLASSAGLPLSFDWQYRDDLNQRGVWHGPALSLQRRADPGVRVDHEGRATNRSDVALTIEYVQIGDAFHSVRQTVQPGQTVAVLPTGADPVQATIPAEAVAYSGMDPFRFEQDFHIVNGQELVEQITVANMLGFDPERGGALDYVEIRLTYRVREGEASDEASAGPYRLSARGTKGSEMTVSFLKPQRALRQIRISGTAYYENESSQKLTTTAFSDLTIKITEEMLP